MEFFRAACRLAVLAIVIAGMSPAWAVEAINVRTDADVPQALRWLRRAHAASGGASEDDVE